MSQEVLSVTELVQYLKRVVETEPLFKNVAIVGEISNFTPARSGHFYFSLKDEHSSIKCVMFKSSASQVLFKPKNGDKVIVTGKMGVYPASGEVQFYVNRMNLDGLGDLFIEFERLKKELFEKGYFDKKHKKVLPEYPMKIGIVTGSGSAALADMTRTLKERWPIATQYNFYSLVQGDQAKGDLVNQIKKADNSNLDLIILARGGGSIEDLWPFNEIEVVLAVFEASTPIVTGVGHESDVTLVDYVSDHRAATPTGAVMDATPHYNDVDQRITNYKNRMYLGVKNNYLNKKQQFNYILEKDFLKKPTSILDVYYMDLDHLQNRLYRNIRYFDDISNGIARFVLSAQKNMELRLMMKHRELMQFDDDFPKYLIGKLREDQRDLSSNQDQLIKGMEELVFLKKRAFSDILKTMKHLSPFEIMSRGYGAVFKEDKSISYAKNLEVDDEFELVFEDGILKSIVIERVLDHE